LLAQGCGALVYKLFQVHVLVQQLLLDGVAFRHVTERKNTPDDLFTMSGWHGFALENPAVGKAQGVK